MKTILLFISIFLYSMSAYTQSREIDSMQKVLQTYKDDTNKVNTLNELCNLLILNNNIKPVSQYANQALRLSGKLSFTRGVAKAHENIATVFSSNGDYTKSLQNLFTALQIWQEIKDKEGVEDVYLKIARVHSIQNNPPETFRYYFLYLKAADELNDSAGVMTAHSEIGREYTYQEDFSNALKQFNLALQYAKNTASDFGTSSVYTDIIGAYRQIGDFQKAFEAADKSLKIHRKLKDLRYIAFDYLNIAFIYRDLGDKTPVSNDVENAKKYYLNALANFFEFQNHYPINDTTASDKGNLSATYAEIGNIYIKLGNFINAKKYYDRSIIYAKEIRWWDNLKSGYDGLYFLDSARGNYSEALKNYKLFVLYRDSITNKENIAKSENSRLQYEFDKKQDSTKAVQTKKDALAATELKNQKLIRNFSISGAVAVLSFGGYSLYRYRRRRKLQSQQEMLNERLRISRELHDDMGSTLGSISIYSEVAKNRSAKNENADEVISKIGAASRELIEKMSDIVWSINPNNESFEQLQNRMQSFAAMILTPQGIQYNFIVDEAVKKIQLTTEERKNIFLIFKEAIHNIVKYAECKKVEIILAQQNDRLEMIIKDDGKGFDVSKLYNPESLGGNGIKNMKARAESMNAGFKVDSALDKGTIIEFNVNSK